jgi:two-component system phosphate regulon response regulator PhoB
LEAGTLSLDLAAHRLRVDGADIELTATEFRLLEFLMGRSGRVQSRDALLAEVWGYTKGVDSRTVDTHIRRLRRKLGAEADRIETLVGVGYRFKA